MADELISQLAGFRSAHSVLDGDGAPPAPTDEDVRQRPYASPGEPALLPIGVVYQAGWEALGDGLARHARAQVRALAQSGLPVSLRPLAARRMVLEDEITPAVLAEVGHLRATSLAEVAVAIRHLVFSSAQHLENVICPPGARLAGIAAEREVYARTIVYTSWERSTVAAELVELLSRCGQVWVPCLASHDAFLGAGLHTSKVRIMPCPYEPDRSLVCKLSSPRGSEAVPGGKRFYAIGKWEPRKAYHTLIGAFLQEMRPTERVALLIKTHEWGRWDGYPTPAESLARWREDAAVKAKGWTPELIQRRVAIVTKELTEEQIALLHREGNIYVSSSHGEAWDMPAFDACCAGNRLVYTGYGGADEYAGKDDGSVRLWPREPTMVPVHPGYGREPRAMWADVPIELLRQALRRAEPPLRRRHPPYLYGRYGAHQVGQLMREQVLRVAGESARRLVAAGGFG